MVTKSWLAALVVLVGCQTPAATPPRPPPPPAVAVLPSAEPSKPPAPHVAEVPALRTEMAKEGYDVAISFNDKSHEHVGIINWRNARPVAAPPLGQINAWLAAHADALGYGPLGAARPDGGWETGQYVLTVVKFPNAGACPDLYLEAAFAMVDSSTFAPKMWHIACPSLEGEGWTPTTTRQFESYRQSTTNGSDDRLGIWLRSEKLSTTVVNRSPESARATVARAAVPADMSRLAYVKGLAERAAHVEGLPPLDIVTLSPPSAAARFHSLELRLAKPPLDGRCIDPRVVVELAEETPATFWVASVEVQCEKEPPGGNTPPADTARTLPKTMASSAPYIAVCKYVNWSTRTRGGTVIDKRGDVYSFLSGAVASDKPDKSDKSAHELGMLMRHGKKYMGTLAPTDVERLVALTPTVEGEPFTQRHVEVFDAPEGGCALLRSGGGDALVPIPFSAGGREQGARSGPASKAAQLLLTRAEELR